MKISKRNPVEEINSTVPRCQNCLGEITDEIFVCHYGEQNDSNLEIYNSYLFCSPLCLVEWLMKAYDLNMSAIRAKISDDEKNLKDLLKSVDEEKDEP